MNVLVLQNYMRQTLGSYAPLQGLVGQRIYDRVPAAKGRQYPYIVIRVGQGVNMPGAECVIDWEVTAQLDVWSREVGQVQAKQIGVHCDDALAERHPVLPGMRMGWFTQSTQRWLEDPDGLTTHGVLEYVARYGPGE